MSSPDEIANPTETATLDPDDPEHVAAAHEAGHAIGLDRAGEQLRSVVLINGPNGRTNGDTRAWDRTARSSDRTEAWITFISAMSGPLAEKAVAGIIEAEHSDVDLELAEQACTALGREFTVATDALETLIASDRALDAVTRIALALLKLPAGISLDPSSVHAAIADALGPRDGAWMSFLDGVLDSEPGQSA